MTDTQSSPPPVPSQPKAEKVVGWAQRLNGEYASIVRWVALGAFIYGTIRGRVDIMGGAVGGFVLPTAVGKPQ